MVFELHELSDLTRRRLEASGLEVETTLTIIDIALAEDTSGRFGGVGSGIAGGVDVTSRATIPAGQRSRVHFRARSAGVIAGSVVVAAVIERVCGAGASEIDLIVDEGHHVDAGAVLAVVEAPSASMLTAERTALNLLCHLSGVATLTQRWVDALEGTGARVRDTRKTMPGLRALEKHAVRCGGGVNHRMGLYDAALIKDNHIAAAGGITAAYRQVLEQYPGLAVEVEVDSIEQLGEALSVGAGEVLLDNFGVDLLLEAVRLRDRTAPEVRLEASGGLTLDAARSVGETGVDYLAVGELTHSARALDIGLDFIEVR